MKSINDLNRLEESVAREIREAVVACVDSGWYILGKNVSAFEEEFAAYVGTNHCSAVGNGTDALEIGLKALGVGSGDQVVTVANAGFYSSIAILACGAEPVYADIDAATHTMSADGLRAVISGRTKAVIVTHLYGRLADVASIGAICRERGIPLLEDCAQAHGSRLNGRMAGSFGDLACFSFYPTKNLGAMGDGGALCSSDQALAERVRTLRQYGWARKYHVEIPRGRNSRLDEMQAAVLRVKLRHLDRWNAARRAIAERYNDEIINPRIVAKPPLAGEAYVAHLYVLETADRDDLAAHLKAKGVPCDIHYPLPDHRQKLFASKYADTVLENTERACSRVLTLPCFPEMTGDDAAQVIDAVNAWNRN